MANESKTIISQLKEAQEGFEQLKADAVKFDGIKADLENQIQGLTKQVEAAKAASIEAAAAVELEKANNAKLQGEIDGCKAIIANPAFADALTKGTASAASVDGGSVGNASGADEMTSTEAHKEYAKLTDAKAKSEFRRDNWKALGIDKE